MTLGDWLEKLDAETATEAATEAAALCTEHGWPGGVVREGDREVAVIDRAGYWYSSLT